MLVRAVYGNIAAEPEARPDRNSGGVAWLQAISAQAVTMEV